MHLDVVGPRRDSEMLREPVAARAVARRGLEAEAAAHAGAKAVGGEQVARFQPVDAHAGRVLADVAHAMGEHGDAERAGALEQRAVQLGAADAEPGAAREAPARAALALDVADPDEGAPSRDLDAGPFERGDGRRHQPLAAGLVEHAGARLEHRDVEARARRLDGGVQAHRAPAGHQHVAAHAHASSAAPRRRLRT